jgi:glucose/arabinose dehydrogenase
MDLVASGLHFPTSVVFAAQGTFLAESGLPFGGAKPGGRVLHLAADRSLRCVKDGLRSPVNGLTVDRDQLIIAEGGNPGRLSRFDAQGQWSVVLDGLPGLGNYHTNMVAVGPDGRYYFGQGAMTNTGIMGLDAYELGWLRRLPHDHDLPGHDLELAGVNVETPNPLSPTQPARASTGAFVPFNTATPSGHRIAATLPCTAAVLSCTRDGSDLRLEAWGVRNAYGLGFLPDGRLLALDQGSDDRGSRPLGQVPDLLFEIQRDRWYGWPDYIGDIPVTDPRFRPTRGPAPEFVLANHDRLPPRAAPLLQFPVNAAATKFAVFPSGPWQGQLVVALFGDEKPMTAPLGPKVGRGLVRVDPSDWSMHPFAAGPFSRPIDVAFDPADHSLHVLDFGEFEMTTDQRVEAKAGSGKLWRLSADDLADAAS